MCQDKQNNVKPGELCKFYSSLFYSSSEPLANDLSTLSLFFDKDAIDHPNTHPPSICHGFPFPPPTITHSTSSPTSTPHLTKSPLQPFPIIFSPSSADDWRYKPASFNANEVTIAASRLGRAPSTCVHLHFCPPARARLQTCAEAV